MQVSLDSDFCLFTDHGTWGLIKKAEKGGGLINHKGYILLPFLLRGSVLSYEGSPSWNQAPPRLN